jgi:hypothetical protein
VLQLHSGIGLGTIHQRSHLFGIHLHINSSDDVSMEGDGGVMELTFLCFDKQLVPSSTQERVLELSWEKQGYRRGG